ncbi:MAG: helix-hairpin-helix domain-containing protein, partial [Cyclobacteriaceae bacterium]|nr:helix-hairpin-helix domain-containing protein [Cyclobacteriaceae bacterium]
KKAPFENVLFALGIRYVGKTVAEKLARHFKSLEALATASYEELVNAPEVGEKIAQSIIRFFSNPENQNEIERLRKAGLNFALDKNSFVPESTVLNNKSFVISGVFKKYGRDELKELIIRNGGRVLSGVSGKLDYLVAGENMGPAKLEKARQLGIRIISEEELERLLNGESI